MNRRVNRRYQTPLPPRLRAFPGRRTGAEREAEGRGVPAAKQDARQRMALPGRKNVKGRVRRNGKGS